MTDSKKGGGFRGRRRIIRDQRRSFSGRLDELIEALTADFGTDPGPVEMALIETAATLQVRAEELQEQLRLGKAVNDNTLVRVTNAASRNLDLLAEASDAARIGRMCRPLSEGQHDAEAQQASGGRGTANVP
jgi:uncharacterized protein YheU (UPF0270 family)